MNKKKLQKLFNAKKRILLILSIVLILPVSVFYCINKIYYHHLEPVELSNTKYLHFSLDDTKSCIKHLSVIDKNSIFEEPTLKTLKNWHNKYGIKVSLYIQGDYTINKKYSKEIIDNSEWLKFGYHGIGERKKGIFKFYRELQDSLGSNQPIDKFTRLDYFHGNNLTCKILKHYGIKGFLTADDWSYNKEKRKTNYYLSDKQSDLLDKENRMFDLDDSLYFVKTDFRLEQIDQRFGSVDNLIKYYMNNTQSNELIVFSHESIFQKYEMQADSIFYWAKLNGFKFDFVPNIR